MKYKARLEDILKINIMEVNGKDFSSYPVETQRDMITKVIQHCSPEDLRLICQDVIQIVGDIDDEIPYVFNYNV